MKKLLIILLAVAMPFGLALFGYLLLSGPRMIEQPKIRAFEARTLPPPAGSVTVESAREAMLLRPLPATPRNIEAGRVYYRYYCLACHGENGNGFGPVGESFVPFPSDLRSARVQSMSHDELMRAMVSGPGHQPAPPFATSQPTLETIVLPQHRPAIALYVRSLAGTQPGQ